MKLTLLTILFIGVVTAAEDRALRFLNKPRAREPRHNREKKRQAQYGGGGGGGYNGAASYQAPRHHQPQQHQPQQNYYQPQPAYGGHQQQPHQQPAPNHYAQAPAHKKAAAPGEEEKEEGPHPLQQLLEKSKFECGVKKDGYYADSDVGCQAFHYCVGGHKHSMMCPAGTVFHQVHLNCVPSDQDICSKADKFYFVNDYLHKQLEQRGPNNTIQYQHRYYPDGYAVGDPFIPPAEAQSQQGGQGAYAQPPAYGQAPQHHQPAVRPHQPAYGAQQAYQPAPQQHHAAPQAAHHARPAYQHAPAPAPAHGGQVQHFPPAGYSHQQAAPSYQAPRPAAPPSYQAPRPAAAPAYGAPQQQQHPGVLPPHAQYGVSPRSRFATQY